MVLVVSVYWKIDTDPTSAAVIARLRIESDSTKTTISVSRVKLARIAYSKIETDPVLVETVVVLIT